MKIEEFLKKHKEAFANDFNQLGDCSIRKHVIKTTAETPIYLFPYRKSMAERKAIEEEIEKMLEAGVIQPSRSPWSFPVVMIPKKDGTKRFCVDYRKLNKITDQDPFPLPRIDDILDRLRDSKIFSALDLKSGYWQVRLDEGSIPKTAFSTHNAHYEWLRLPFGLRNAPAEFSRIMVQVLGDLTFVEIYLDDITVHSVTIDQHFDHLEVVFNRLKEANLKINKAKCTWFSTSIKVLGHIVSAQGVQMDVEKIEAVKNYQYSRNVKQLQQFLGLCGYYRRFVKDFAKIAQPLYKLLKKETIWNFDEACIKAFEKLRTRLIEYPILRQADFNRPFVLYTDASGLALGAILSQSDDQGAEYVCAYASRLLKNAEIHYGITEKEGLGVVWGIKYFRI